MRRALLLAAACVCLGQTGFAMGIVKLSKPNTSYAAFMEDRSICLNTASHRKFSSYPGVSSMFVSYDLYEFADCMTTKGYKLDPNGYRAVWYFPPVNGHTAIVADAPHPQFIW
jgi:hypothetical protein